MESDVKPSGTRRRYDTTRRAAAAAETRRAVLSAARALFLERGYSATTVAAIADSAGVAVDTVYASVGPKSTLFRLLIETALSGTDQPLRADDRDYVHSIHEEPDAARKLAIYARAVSSIHERLAPLFVVLRDAAQGEPDLAALWAEISERRARNMRRFVAEVAEAAGGLRNGLDIDQAADIVWATNAPDFYLRLRHEREWTSEQFERVLSELWIRMLLPKPDQVQ